MKMKQICFLKECDNFDGDFDCILHYTKIHNDALQKIVMHYNALRTKVEEVMLENIRYGEEAKKDCKNKFEAIYNLMRKRTTDKISPETCKSSTSPDRSSKDSLTNSPRSCRKYPLNSKENSPKRKRSKSKNNRKSSKEKCILMSIDPKPSQEKRTKQTKLSFFTTKSTKSPSDLPEEQDDDMTYCEELENPFKSNDPKNTKIKSNSSELFNFHGKDNLPWHQLNSSNKEQKIKKEDKSGAFANLKIKQEDDNSKENHINQNRCPLSPELFLSDMSSSNSVLFIEPSEKEIITIPDRTYNPTRDLIKELDQELKESRKKRLFDDSVTIELPGKEQNFQIDQRDPYEGECLDCKCFYDNLVQNKSLLDANKEINNCPIRCDGWKERCKKLKPKKPGVVVIKCNNKFARRRKDDYVNETAPGIWDLNVEPRKSKPLFAKPNENYETPDL